MLADTSQTLRVLIVGDIPGVEVWRTHLARLNPPASVKQLSGETDDPGEYDLVLVPSPAAAARQRRDALVCESRVDETGGVHLVPVRSHQGPLVCLIDDYLHACPDAAIQRLAEQMRLVNEASLEIAGMHDLEEILNLIPDQLTETFDYHHAAVGLIGPDHIEMYESSQTRRAVEPDHFRISPDANGIIPWVARTGIVHLANDTHQDELWTPGKGLEASRSELTVPLLYHDRVIGVIDVQSQQVGAFDQSDVSVLEALAGQLAVAIENVRLLERIRQQHRLAEMLSHISRLVSTQFDIEQISQTVVRELGQLMHFDTAFMALIEDNTFRVTHQIGYGTKEVEDLRWLVEESPLLYRVINQRAPVLIADTTEDRRWQKLAQKQPTRSWLGVPLLSREQPIGVLVVSRFVPQAYQQADANTLLALANQIAGVIDNALLLERSEQREREARALYEITHLLVTLDRETILTSLLRQLGEALVFDAAGILVVGETARMAITARREVTPTATAELGDRLCRAFNALSQEPVNSHTLSRQVIRTGSNSEGDPIESLPARLSAPLLVGRHVIGVMEVCKAGPEPYTDSVLRTLYTIANSTATALENARLYEELMDRAINLQQAADELAAADRLKDELVGNVSHELRAPLTYVMGYVDLLLAGDMGELTPEQHKSLEIVSVKTRMLARLVSDILCLEKTQAEDLVLAPVNLVEIAQQVVHDITRTAEEAGIQIVTELDPRTRPVMGDAGRIEQVFNNLLGNALKFSPEGSTITVRVLLGEQHVRAEVADRGIGIPEDKLSRIFDRFYQVSLDSRRRYGGVGLGLAICKQLIEAHGGRIGVTSQVGVGSTFYFELPSFGPSLSSTDVDGTKNGAGDHI